jgi:hypothetical protein
MKRLKIKAKLNRDGVDIYDGHSDQMVGITEIEALDLLQSLKKLKPRLQKKIKQWGLTQ